MQSVAADRAYKQGAAMGRGAPSSIWCRYSPRTLASAVRVGACCVLLIVITLLGPAATVQARNGGAIGALNVRLSDLPKGSMPRQHITKVPSGPGKAGCGQPAAKLPIRLLAIDGTVYFSPLTVSGMVLTAYITAGLSLAGSASDAHRFFLAQRRCFATQLGHTVPVAGMAVGHEHVALYQPCATGPQALQGFTILFRRGAYVELLSLISGCPATASRAVATSLHQKTARLAGRVDARLLSGQR